MFENFIKKLQERIEKNAVKIPNISWTEKDGTVHTEDIILKRSRLPLVGDWGRIHPPLDEDGKPIWLNIFFGGRKNFITLILILAIAGMVLMSYYEFFSQYNSLRTLCEPFLNQTINVGNNPLVLNP